MTSFEEVTRCLFVSQLQNDHTAPSIRNKIGFQLAERVPPFNMCLGSWSYIGALDLCAVIAPFPSRDVTARWCRAAPDGHSNTDVWQQLLTKQRVKRVRLSCTGTQTPSINFKSNFQLSPCPNRVKKIYGFIAADPERTIIFPFTVFLSTFSAKQPANSIITMFEPVLVYQVTCMREGCDQLTIHSDLLMVITAHVAGAVEGRVIAVMGSGQSRGQQPPLWILMHHQEGRMMWGNMYDIVCCTLVCTSWLVIN